MIRRHLKLGANSRFECSRTVWRDLMKRVDGHIKIGAGARVVIHDPDVKESSHGRQRTARPSTDPQA